MGRSLSAVHANTVLDVLAGGRSANSGLAASWRRSGHLHALDPTNRAPSRRLTQAELVGAQERLGRWLRVAQSTLDRLFLAVGGVGCSVLLADGGGLVVDRRGTLGSLDRCGLEGFAHKAPLREVFLCKIQTFCAGDLRPPASNALNCRAWMAFTVFAASLLLALNRRPSAVN